MSSGPSADPHPLPDLDIFNLSSGNPSSNVGATKKPEEAEEEIEDNLPLFYQYERYIIRVNPIEQTPERLLFI
jgi:hypothetical protein